AEVERERAVGDVLEVVCELLLPGRLAGDARLREAGQAGTDDQALPVLRDRPRQLFEKGRPDRPRADEAHVAAEDVPQLRQLVELRGSQPAPEPGHLRLRSP